MNRILISGTNSYVGSSFIDWMSKNNHSDCLIETISLRNNSWRDNNLSSYDTIIHLAAIVHSSKASSEQYYKVNRDLTLELATRAKKQGVKHFIFFSTLSVYGFNQGIIDFSTQTNPSNDYGKSKLEAEKELIKLESKKFKITIVRAPMIYGPNCPGNFSKLLKLFFRLPFFPRMNNKRSMIFIDNLSEFLNVIIQNQISGIYIPQNEEYVSTLSIFKTFRKKIGKKDVVIPFLIPGYFIEKNSTLEKLFSDLIVDEKLSILPINYQNVSFEESIAISGEAYLNHEK